MNKIKKVLFTLNVNDGYSTDVTDLTYPYLKRYAHKIGAEFYVIKERKFPDWYITYEKLQIYELAKEMKSDWNYYIDCDALIHPDTFDFTTQMNKDTVAHSAMDMAAIRWKYDEYFLRDGRNIGSCNWFSIGSDWCLDLWKPLDDLTPDEAAANIFPIKSELDSGVTPRSLIDDYVLSRNISKYGLKFVMFKDFFTKYNLNYGDFMFHLYAMPQEEKAVRIKDVIVKKWHLPISKNVRDTYKDTEKSESFEWKQFVGSKKLG